MEKGSARTPSAPRRTAADRQHSPSRERVLRSVEALGSATLAEITARTELHPNTVRGHLQRLVADGYLAQAPEPHDARGARGTRGRPALRWRCIDPEHTQPYVGLAVALADALAQTGTQAHALAAQVGAAWGAQLASTRSEAEPRALVTRVMHEQGFAPDAVPAPAATGTGTGTNTDTDTDTSAAPILLHHCPLRSAVDRSDVVCAVHQGVVTGLARSRDPEAHVELRPFVSPGVCALQLSSAA